jgi:hypothetical protein
MLSVEVPTSIRNLEIKQVGVPAEGDSDRGQVGVGRTKCSRVPLICYTKSVDDDFRGYHIEILRNHRQHDLKIDFKIDLHLLYHSVFTRPRYVTR